jgi:voltage-gated potassium channel
MQRPRWLDRRLERFRLEPPSVGAAARLIVAGTTIIVVIGALLMWALDHHEYPNIGRALWWAAQTVTTVGYGDVTPKNTSGRIIAVVVMFWGVAFLAILTASIASAFISARERTRAVADAVDAAADQAAEDVRMDDVVARLDRIEQQLSRLTHN